MDYKSAGVDIEAGYASVELMKEHVKKTMRPEVLGGLGVAHFVETKNDVFAARGVDPRESVAEHLPGLFGVPLKFLG